jgi:hypothetical protein
MLIFLKKNMKKRPFKIFSLISFLLGIFFLINTKATITGNIIGISNISNGFSFILSIVFILVGVLFFAAGKSLEKKINEVKINEYYKKRVKEIFNPNYDTQDVWVSRWELDGIMNYIKNSKDGKGDPKYKNSSFEHGTDTPSMHPIGKYQLLHLKACVKTKDNYIRRHLLITDDPSDPRLKNIGIYNNKKIRSKVYREGHPRDPKKAYKRKIYIGGYSK